MKIHKIQLKIDQLDQIYQGLITLVILTTNEHRYLNIETNDYIFFQCESSYVLTKVLNVANPGSYLKDDYIAVNFKVLDKG
jgi:hypothetical protein